MDLKPPNYYLRKLENTAIRLNSKTEEFAAKENNGSRLSDDNLNRHVMSVDRYCEIIAESVCELRESIKLYHGTGVGVVTQHPLLSDISDLIRQKQLIADALVDQLEQDAELNGVIGETLKNNTESTLSKALEALEDGLQGDLQDSRFADYRDKFNSFIDNLKAFRDKILTSKTISADDFLEMITLVTDFANASMRQVESDEALIACCRQAPTSARVQTVQRLR